MMATKYRTLHGMRGNSGDNWQLPEGSVSVGVEIEPATRSTPEQVLICFPGGVAFYEDDVHQLAESFEALDGGGGE